jgi:hypothetical protein
MFLVEMKTRHNLLASCAIPIQQLIKIMEVEDEGLLKDLVVIFVFLGALYCSVFLLISESYLKINKIKKPCNTYNREPMYQTEITWI